MSTHIVLGVVGGMLGLFVLAGILGWFLAWLLYIPVPRKLPGRDDKSKLWSYMWRIKLIKFYSWWKAKFVWKRHRVVMIREYIAKYFTPQKRPLISAGDPDLKVKNCRFSGVAVKLYSPKAGGDELRPGMIYLHGGCWIFGSADYMDAVTTVLAKRVNMVVASVNYRLAPEHTYPVPLDDCVAATKHLLIHAHDYKVDPDRVVIAGDSAGGNLAAVVALRLRDEGFKPCLKMQALMYPCLQAVTFQLPTHEMNDEDPYLDRKFIISCYLWYAVGNNKLLKKVLKNQHISKEMQEKVKKYVDVSLLPEEEIETIKPNTEILRKGKLVMNDENATPSEKEALLWEVFDSSAAIEEGMELKDEKNGEANKDSSPKSEKEVEKSPEQEKGEKSTTKEEPGKYSKKDYLPVPEPTEVEDMKPGVQVILEKPAEDKKEEQKKEEKKDDEDALLINPNDIEHIFTDPYFSPLLAEDMAGLPHTYLLTCEQDLVRDEALLFKRRLEEAGVPVEHVHFLSLHALLDCVADVTYARYALDCLAEYLKKNL